MSSRKKIRGIKRRIQKFNRELNELTKDFPENLSYGYWEIHLPGQGSEWINAVKTPYNVRKQCLQVLINRTKFLIDRKPEHHQSVKVMLMIDFHYWYSTKIEFFLPEADNGGVELFREDAYTRWVPLDKNRDFAAEWGLNIPAGLEIRGIQEEIRDLELGDEDIYGGEIWFIGELS